MSAPQVWFTADTHFNHRAMIEKAWRPEFATVAEMNEALIENWNAAVRPADTVWHLGDFAMGNPMHALPIVGRLHGTKHLIAGNHDRCWPGFRDAHRWQGAFIEAGFASVQAFARRRIDGRAVQLSHLPYRGDHFDGERFEQYRLRELGDPLLCGHVHDAWATDGRQLNVGVDVHAFGPVHLDTITGWVAQLPTEQET